MSTDNDLHISSSLGDAEFVSNLIEKGGDVNLANEVLSSQLLSVNIVKLIVLNVIGWKYSFNMCCHW